ncbi:MAG: hypothetical protein AB2704_02440, partial [Candidatus Thiodiazotropha taylori]
MRGWRSQCRYLMDSGIYLNEEVRNGFLVQPFLQKQLHPPATQVFLQEIFIPICLLQGWSVALDFDSR